MLCANPEKAQHFKGNLRWSDVTACEDSLSSRVGGLHRSAPMTSDCKPTMEVLYQCAITICVRKDCATYPPRHTLPQGVPIDGDLFALVPIRPRWGHSLGRIGQDIYSCANAILKGWQQLTIRDGRGLRCATQMLHAGSDQGPHICRESCQVALKQSLA